MYIYTYIYIYIHTSLSFSLCIYIYTYIYIYVYIRTYIRKYTCICKYVYIYPPQTYCRGSISIRMDLRFLPFFLPYIYIYIWRERQNEREREREKEREKERYGVATICRLLQIISFFCKRALLKRRYSARETDNFKEPTNRSHPIRIYTCICIVQGIDVPTYACGVATISRLLKIIDLFCKRTLQKRLYSAKETYNFKEPTHVVQGIVVHTCAYKNDTFT